MEQHTKTDFINRLMEEKGLDNIPEEVREQMSIDLEQRLDKMIDITILDNIHEDDLTEFDEKLNSDNKEEIQSFLKKKIPNMEELVAGVMMKFRDIYLGKS